MSGASRRNARGARLEAYPFTRYGVVEHIGRDAVQTEKEGLLYPARIRLKQAWLDIGGRRTWLAPGLAATAEIKTGDWWIIEYLALAVVTAGAGGGEGAVKSELRQVNSQR